MPTSFSMPGSVPIVCRFPGQASPEVTVIVPTLNEEENIVPLISRILAVAGKTNFKLSILVVDGGSLDGTREAVRHLAASAPVRLVESDGGRGLAGDVLLGAEEAASDIVVVMDADLSHPPEALPDLVRPLLVGTHDMAIGSRYVPGGGTPGWPWRRRLASRAATLLSWPLVSAKDPMSGFFAVRRDLLRDLGRGASGFKIALEILARSDDTLRVAEIPIKFVDRAHGESKLGVGTILSYLHQLITLAGGALSTGSSLRFAAVGAAGVMVDALIFNLLLLKGNGLMASHVTSFLAATLFNYLLNAHWAFRKTAGSAEGSKWWLYLRFLVVCILALFFRGAVLGFLTETAGWPPTLAILLAIGAAAAVNYVGLAFFVFPIPPSRKTPQLRWRVLAISLVLYSILLRLIFAGLVDLIPEESYYWNYAQHLDWGYLDHPPFVAWLIRAGTALLGHHELAVRLPALLSWGMMAFFMYRLANNLYGKTAAFGTTLLLAVLPIYFFVGLLMTPDAPLYMAWAGSLFFLERALLAGKSRAWLGFGVCLGLGMLSKYTIALLGPAVVLFIIIDRRSWHWFRRPEPYFALCLAIAFFAPVIYWNATHDWCSFAFQGTRRWSGSSQFSLPALLGSALGQLTPVGLVGLALSFRPYGEFRKDSRLLFAALFVLIPLSVFIAHSFKGETKPNWTGPIWLAALPYLAWQMSHQAQTIKCRAKLLTPGLWKPLSVCLLVVYGGLLYGVQIGLPGFTGGEKMRLPAAWQEMAGAVDQIEKNLKNETGLEPLVVGMDKYFLSSQLAFYDPGGPQEIAGRHLFGGNSLMWEYWLPRELAKGRNVIMVDFEKKDLGDDLTSFFRELGPILDGEIMKNGQNIGRFFYRVGYDFNG